MKSIVSRIKENHVITIDYNKENNSVFISEDNSSGCEYTVFNKKDLKDAINSYIDLYVK